MLSLVPQYTLTGGPCLCQIVPFTHRDDQEMTVPLVTMHASTGKPSRVMVADIAMMACRNMYFNQDLVRWLQKKSVHCWRRVYAQAAWCCKTAVISS